jgi:hypothetical protein
MAKRQVDIVFVGPTSGPYSVIQRFAGESTKLHATIRWVRQVAHILDEAPPETPTVWVVADDIRTLELGQLLNWLDRHGLSSAGIVLVPDGSREHVSRVKAMGGANLLRSDKMTASVFERLIIHAATS